MAQGQKRRAVKDTSPAAEVTSLGVEELYRKIADSTSDWEYWLDPQGNYVFLSPACERLTGYAREEFLADPGLVERLVHPDDRAGFEQHIERVHVDEQQRKAIEIELRIIARDGSERWINHRCAGMFDPDGRYLGRRASNVDVSRYKLAEEKLLLLNRELLAVRDSARTVLRATDELKLLRDVCRIMCNTAGYRMAWIGLVEHDEGKTVRPVAWSGVEDGYLASVGITWADTERGRGPTGTAARTGKSTVIADYASDPQGDRGARAHTNVDTAPVQPSRYSARAARSSPSSTSTGQSRTPSRAAPSACSRKSPRISRSGSALYGQRLARARHELARAVSTQKTEKPRFRGFSSSGGGI